MRQGQLTTMNGKVVTFNVPETGRDIELKRFLPARVVFDEIQGLFNPERGTLYEVDFLRKVIEFLGHILDIPPNDLFGFPKGKFSENMTSLHIVSHNLPWQKIDTSIYRLYQHIGGLLAAIKPENISGDYEFEYKGEKWIVPDWLIKFDIYEGDSADLPAWQAVEALEVQRLTAEMLQKTIPRDEYGNEIPQNRMTDDEKQSYVDTMYTQYLKLLAVLARPEGSKQLAYSLGQDAVDKMIEKRVEHFRDIDVQTAYECFFFGLDISSIAETAYHLLISGILPTRKRQKR